MCNKYAASDAAGTENGEPEHPYKNLKGLLYSLSPGQTGCLQSGETFDEHVAEMEHHGGAEGAPVTITSTNPSEPAIITNAVRLYAGSNYITIEHVDFRWYMPQAVGDVERGGQRRRHVQTPKTPCRSRSSPTTTA